MTLPTALAGSVNGELNHAVERHFVRRGRGPEFEMEVDWIRSHLPGRSARVLDVGCGAGGLFDAIGRERAIGIDYSEQGLMRSQATRGNVPVLCADAVRTPFADGSMDAVTAQHVIEHLPDYEAACREWRRILKTGGLLLVVTPNASFVDPTVFEDETHVHLFDGPDLTNTMERAGLEVLETFTLGLPWLRRHHHLPAGWRLRRFLTTHARGLARAPGLRWRGQTLCCAARRPH